MVFCEDSDMLLLLRRYLLSIRFPFVYVDGEVRLTERARQIARFSRPQNDAICLLTAASTPSKGAADTISGVSHVVFYDVERGMTTASVAKWIR